MSMPLQFTHHMSPTYDRIVWPAKPEDAHHLYIGFALQVIHALGMDFSKIPDAPNNPIEIASLYLADMMTIAQMSAAANQWWDYLYLKNLTSGYGTKAFRDRNTLMARFALCLLSLYGRRAQDYSQLVQWTLEYAQHWDGSDKRAMQIMQGYFMFSDHPVSPTVH